MSDELASEKLTRTIQEVTNALSESFQSLPPVAVEFSPAGLPILPIPMPRGLPRKKIMLA